VVSEKRIILPAFGSFTGLKNIKHEKDDKIFLTNGKEIQELG
jgi:metallophosphoesterase superfamily enzyme